MFWLDSADSLLFIIWEDIVNITSSQLRKETEA